jgi:hypothetical protein
MENYFNRNNIKPVNYFNQYANCETLEMIWNKFHHKVYYSDQVSSSMRNSEMLSPIFNQGNNRIRKKSETIDSSHEVDLKKKRVETLEQQISHKNKIIEDLRAELADLKDKKIGVGKKISGGGRVTHILGE